jgi:hypothetical protein
MTARVRLGVALGAVAAGSAVPLASGAAGPEMPAAPPERPNIVGLETDDQTLAEFSFDQCDA